MARPVRSPLRVFRRDSGDAVVAAAATVGPVGIPVYGFSSIVIFARFTAEGTITIQQYLRSGSTAVTTTTIAITAAGGGYISQSVEVTGEVANIRFTNDDSANQTPEIIVTLE